MENSAQTETASKNELEIKLEIAKGFSRLLKRLWPGSGRAMASELRVVEIEWELKELELFG